MAQKYTIQAKARSASVQAIRRQGSIPAVLYGHGVASENLEVDSQKFGRVFRDAGTNSLITLTTDGGNEHPVIVRDIQLHPLKGHVTHIDFYQVRLDEEITAEIPLEFVGESSAVKDLGGTFVRNIDAIEVEALPQNLPHNIEVDISILDSFEKVIHVSDLKVPEGVKIMLEPNDVIALVQEPRTQEEIDAELAEVATEDVESVEGVKKEDTEEQKLEEGAAAPEEKKE